MLVFDPSIAIAMFLHDVLCFNRFKWLVCITLHQRICFGFNAFYSLSLFFPSEITILWMRSGRSFVVFSRKCHLHIFLYLDIFCGFYSFLFYLKEQRRKKTSTLTNISGYYWYLYGILMSSKYHKEWNTAHFRADTQCKHYLQYDNNIIWMCMWNWFYSRCSCRSMFIFVSFFWI